MDRRQRLALARSRRLPAATSGGDGQHLFGGENFEGCDGLVLSDEIKLTIASAACLLLLGFEDQYCFDRVRSILVYPRPTAQRRFSQTDGVVNEFQFLSGMAQHGGPILLSWKDVRAIVPTRARQQCGPARVCSSHRWLDGAMEGQPPFATPQLQFRWNEVSAAELKALRGAIQEGRPSVLDPDGGHSPAEFFAVATEAFYCDGLNLFASHAELYGLLSVLYRLETKDWFAAD